MCYKVELYRKKGKGIHPWKIRALKPKGSGMITEQQGDKMKWGCSSDKLRYSTNDAFMECNFREVNDFFADMGSTTSAKQWKRERTSTSVHVDTSGLI